LNGVQTQCLGSKQSVFPQLTFVAKSNNNNNNNNNYLFIFSMADLPNFTEFHITTRLSGLQTLMCKLFRDLMGSFPQEKNNEILQLGGTLKP
jgi:hypothetical protein